MPVQGGVDDGAYDDRVHGQPEPSTDADCEINAAEAAFDAACDRVEAAIRAHPNPDEAFRRADGFNDKIGKLRSRYSALRTAMAGRIWDSERMTLAKLANRIGVGTTRAHQIMEEVKKSRGEQK